MTSPSDLIRAGELVAFPTETVYGLGANALDAAAVRRIYELKRRPSTSPLIVHVASLEMARELASRWPDAAERLARRYWPGPLTLVVPKSPRIPDAVTSGLDTVGLRMPAHAMALDLIREAGVPIAAPSANRFTELSPTTADHVRASFPGLCVIDGGPATVGIESTVLSPDPPILFRPGIIPPDEIEEITGPLQRAADGPGPHASPGMHRRHYSPRTRLYLGEPPGHGNGYRLRPGLEMPADPRGYAAVLYATLHQLDGKGLDWIAVTPPPDTPEWAGVRDRLRRAAQAP